VTSSSTNKLFPIDLTKSLPKVEPGIPVGINPYDLAIGCDLSTTTTTTKSSSTSSSSSTTETTSTSTTTTTPPSQGLSASCTDVSKGTHNGHYTSGGLTSAAFKAGETLTVGVADITGAGSVSGQAVEF